MRSSANSKTDVSSQSSLPLSSLQTTTAATPSSSSNNNNNTNNNNTNPSVPTNIEMTRGEIDQTSSAESEIEVAIHPNDEDEEASELSSSLTSSYGNFITISNRSMTNNNSTTTAPIGTNTSSMATGIPSTPDHDVSVSSLLLSSPPPSYREPSQPRSTATLATSKSTATLDDIICASERAAATVLFEDELAGGSFDSYLEHEQQQSSSHTHEHDTIGFLSPPFTRPTTTGNNEDTNTTNYPTSGARTAVLSPKRQQQQQPQPSDSDTNRSLAGSIPITASIPTPVLEQVVTESTPLRQQVVDDKTAEWYCKTPVRSYQSFSGGGGARRVPLSGVPATPGSAARRNSGFHSINRPVEEKPLLDEIREVLAQSYLIFLLADLRAMSATGRIVTNFENLAVDSDHYTRATAKEIACLFDEDNSGTIAAAKTPPMKGLSPAVIMAVLILEIRDTFVKTVDEKITEHEEASSKKTKPDRTSSKRNLHDIDIDTEENFISYENDTYKKKLAEESMESLTRAYSRMISEDLVADIPNIKRRRDRRETAISMGMGRLQQQQPGYRGSTNSRSASAKSAPYSFQSLDHTPQTLASPRHSTPHAISFTPSTSGIGSTGPTRGIEGNEAISSLSVSSNIPSSPMMGEERASPVGYSFTNHSINDSRDNKSKTNSKYIGGGTKSDPCKSLLVPPIPKKVTIASTASKTSRESSIGSYGLGSVREETDSELGFGAVNANTPASSNERSSTSLCVEGVTEQKGDSIGGGIPNTQLILDSKIDNTDTAGRVPTENVGESDRISDNSSSFYSSIRNKSQKGNHKPSLLRKGRFATSVDGQGQDVQRRSIFFNNPLDPENQKEIKDRLKSRREDAKARREDALKEWNNRVEEMMLPKNREAATKREFEELTDVFFDQGETNEDIKKNLGAGYTRKEMINAMRKGVETRNDGRLQFLSKLFKNGSVSQLMVQSHARIVWMNDWYPLKDLTYTICVDPLQRRVMVVFRGAITVNDWKLAMQNTLYKIKNPVKEAYEGRMETLRVFSGLYIYLFRKRKDTGTTKYDEIANMAHKYGLERIGPGYRLFVTGHSLGGALTHFFSFYASTEDRFTTNGPVKAIAFASPYIGGHSWADAIRHQERAKKIQLVQVRNHSDLIPRMPKNFRIGKRGPLWRHVGIGVTLPSLSLCGFRWKPMVHYWGKEKSVWDSTVHAYRRNLFFQLSTYQPWNWKQYHTLFELQDRLMYGELNSEPGGDFELLQSTVDELYDILDKNDFETFRKTKRWKQRRNTINGRRSDRKNRAK